ncbi:MAG: ATP-binding protein [Myxococcaceae bacterium]
MSLVLVADDEPAVLEVLTEVIEDLGHDVVRAHDGREALQLARAQRPGLVVTDHMMPRLSGVELCRALRTDVVLNSVPVILLSAAIPPEAVEAHAWLSKPFELDEFEALVKRTLDGVKASSASVPAVPPPPRPSAQDPAQELIHWVAHEMKTPLAAARMNLQLFDRKLSASGQEINPQHVRSVSRQLDAMEHIVNALIDAARLSEGQLAISRGRQDLASLLKDVVEHWQEDHPEIAFDVVAPPGQVPAMVDPERMEQILGNLLANAVRHGAPSRHVRIELTRQDSQADVSVQDFGPGILPSMQRTLFQRFPGPATGRTRRPGLGLYIAHELARLHDGKLSVRSVPGNGATFTLSLPLA